MNNGTSKQRKRLSNSQSLLYQNKIVNKEINMAMENNCTSIDICVDKDDFDKVFFRSKKDFNSCLVTATAQSYRSSVTMFHNSQRSIESLQDIEQCQSLRNKINYLNHNNHNYNSHNILIILKQQMEE